MRALVERYGDRVNTWEIWNEPDNGDAVPVETYTAFFIRTATILRSVQSTARVLGLSLAGKTSYAEQFLKQLAEAGKAKLLDEITYHYYPHNPDEGFDNVEVLAGYIRQYAPHVTLRQGETGAPSESRRFLALGQHAWSERKQTAWNLRRMLAHHVRGIPMSLFQLSDMYYSKTKGLFEGCNSKGLLHVRSDKTVAYRKPAYFAAQHVFSLFDDRFPLRPLERLAVEAPFRTEAYAWAEHEAERPTLVAWWRSDDAPGLTTPALETVAVPAQQLNDPVLLDFVSGTIFDLPADADDERVWPSLPCADSPLALIERDALTLWSREDAE